MMDDSKIIGIDLGTTNSVVAVVEGNEPVVIANHEGSNKTPSVVAFLDNNDCIVGEIARRQAATNAERTISSIKRLMGVPFEEVEEWADLLPYKIVEYSDRLLIDVNGMGYSPEQISALVLKKLKESAEAFLGSEVTQAVITVPANFDDNQRNATIEAARLAGLEVLRLINEPTAAALAYGIGKAQGSDEVIAVYDFGGGTFDITILEISNKTFEVLCSTGDAHLGGDDLDNVLADVIVKEFEEKHAVDLTKDPVTIRRLKEVAEKAKCELSTATQAMITLPFIAYKNGAPLHLERSLSRDEFEELIEAFVNRTVRCCKRAIEDAGLSKKDINKVILVGGSTRIPLVQDAVEDFFGLAPFKGINPDEVVALGAATQAGVFSGNIEEVTLIDVAPHSLGIEVKDGKFSRIIEKNATIPIKAAKNFTTTEDNQNYVNIHILQGESSETAENRSLGKFMLTGIPQQPKGRARIRVTFFVNADGVMEISAEELGSGVAKTLTIVHSELDATERKVRKRQKQRKARGVKSREGAGAKRYTMDSKGSPLPGEKRGRNADSSAVELRSPETPRGSGAPAEVEARTPAATGGAVEVEAPRVEDVSDPQVASYTSPKRYTRYESGYTGPTPLRKDGTQGDPLSIPTPPPVAPKHDDATSHFESALSGEATVQMGMIPSDPSASGSHEIISNMDIASDIPVMIEEVDWPGLIDSALDAAASWEISEKAVELYRKAIDVLGQEPWISDGRYPVLRAVAVLQLLQGRAPESRAALQMLAERYGRMRSTEILALYERAITSFATLPDFRRDRMKLREQLGDLEGACEDLEYANKIEASETDISQLERLYRARLARREDPAAQFKLVKIFLKSNRVDEAIEILQQLQHHDAYETRAVKILGLCHWQKNLHFLAWQKFKQLKQNEEIRDILFRLAGDMENTGQLNNALTVYEHVAAESPEYRDTAARIKKIRYRLKVQQEENEQGPAGVLTDPRFTIIEEINRGSMGIIFKAKDKTLDEVVALKVLNDYLTADPSAVERFKREARAAKKLSHPYIVRIHDMFETGSKRFISMEYIEGTDLKRLLAEHTRFNEDQLVYYFLQICDALSYAHKLNIIHRDIKPANVMITKQNNVKVTDFGIAKMLQSDDSTKSGTAVIGTPLYMAPEQITGEGVDQRSDIYALGIMMYELVSGHPPFYLGNIEYHHIHTPPPPLPEKVSPVLRKVIMKCVEKLPTNRYQTVDQIFEELNLGR